MTSETEPASEEVLAHSRASAGFEAVMANAAFGGFGGLLPSAELGRLAKAVVRSPKPVARHVVDLAARLGHVGIGVEDQPGARDRRFADRAWAGNPVLQRLALGTWPPATLHRGSSRTLTWTGAPGSGSD